ncbi:TPA: hypothetical protein ACX3HZ_000884 [Vibrio parahaemolyticus]|uniref:hypothetical protein n=1 Tax=Vibrio TaxID=662 RepID=UPI0007EE35AE|nr:MULTISPECIES: hypothetical protein [Vibrio]MBY7947249.1 hypothetical protein [Vibrio fluvialis]ANN28673.1 hypothetical protein FORC17_3610 [Vibrio vulnificus]MBY8011887.1 hypothetical protein [Vibrio fluvialis]MBY8015387.1 hypothetical protein [Vibrio fluvialis]TOE49815.1 hypothetical protein CGJ41_15605 [Vibrio parahaemolyticus]
MNKSTFKNITIIERENKSKLRLRKGKQRQDTIFEVDLNTKSNIFNHGVTSYARSLIKFNNMAQAEQLDQMVGTILHDIAANKTKIISEFKEHIFRVNIKTEKIQIKVIKSHKDKVKKAFRSAKFNWDDLAWEIKKSSANMKKASQLIQEIKDIATEEDILAVLNVSDGYISKTLLDMTSSKQYQTQNSND